MTGFLFIGSAVQAMLPAVRRPNGKKQGALTPAKIQTPVASTDSPPGAANGELQPGRRHNG